MPTTDESSITEIEQSRRILTNMVDQTPNGLQIQYWGSFLSNSSIGSP